MLSLDLFDSKYEKKLHEGAVDNTIEHLLKPLSLRAAEIRTKLRSGRLNPKQIDQLEKEYEDLVQKRLDIILDRKTQTEQQQPSRAPAKGLLKGKDLITPQQRVAGATPAKPGVMGAVKDVVGGIKRFVKGEPDQGPTFEQLAPGGPGSSPRALGIANFQRIAKANAGFQPTVYFEFIRPEENFKLDQRGIDLISDYYDGLENDQAKNYFIYRVLPSGDETLKVLKQLGWTPPTPVQPELPGMPNPIQGELPLNEKKKSQDSDDIKARDIKVARELQKLRAQYPTAGSDVEAVARAEIDSTERSQRQLAAIRGANEKQDALLKQLVALDQEQGREIDTLDQENNTLEKELAKIQSTNDRLQQAMGQMTGSKKSTRPAPAAKKTIDLIPGAPADVRMPAKAEPQAEPEATPVKATSPAMSAMAKQIQGLAKPAPTIRPVAVSANEPQAQAVAEHGGGIGPRQHWQSLMQEDDLVEGIKDTASATAVIACLLTGGSLQGCATAPQQTTAQQVLKTGQDVGRTVQSAKKITRAGVEAEVNQEIKNVMRGISGQPQELNHSNILRIWKRIKGQPPVQPEPQAPEYGPGAPVKRPTTEAKEIHTRDDFIRERDRLLRMISQETNPANKQILKSAIRQLENRAENEGWIVIQQRMVREDTAALAAEDAILKRIFVKHRDLMMEYGPDKITQAAEAVSYNVGDIAHITDDDINGWIGQVEQILGARP